MKGLQNFKRAFTKKRIYNKGQFNLAAKNRRGNTLVTLSRKADPTCNVKALWLSIIIQFSKGTIILF